MQRAAMQGTGRQTTSRGNARMTTQRGSSGVHGGITGWAFRTVFAVPLAIWSVIATARCMVADTVMRASSSLRFSGFLELAALIATMTLLFWVSGLFLGLALCSVIVAFACLYVLTCAVGMNWMLDRVRVYLRDCWLLRICSGAIPVVSVLKGLRFTTGVTVHFPDKSMVWILHAGNWVVRLCWRSMLEPMRLLKGELSPPANAAPEPQQPPPIVQAAVGGSDSDE